MRLLSDTAGHGGVTNFGALLLRVELRAASVPLRFWKPAASIFQNYFMKRPGKHKCSISGSAISL